MEGISNANSNVILTDITINFHDIGSTTDVTYGIAIWKDSNVNLNDHIINKNTHAESRVELIRKKVRLSFSSK